MQTEFTLKIENNPFQYIPTFFIHGESSHPDQYSWMDEYFNDNVLQLSFHNQPQVSTILDLQNSSSSLSHETETKIQTQKACKRKNKSIFHNFQKHLLTLLKKIIVVKKSDIAHLPYGNRAYDLWRIFLALNSSSKKNLYIIFGVAQRENQNNLKKASESIPELQKLMMRYSIKEIQQGQDLLRRIVYQQATSLQKSKLECQCKMRKFQEFYSYFTGFVQELSQGAISRRMTKQRKLRLVSPLQLQK